MGLTLQGFCCRCGCFFGTVGEFDSRQCGVGGMHGNCGDVGWPC